MLLKPECAYRSFENFINVQVTGFSPPESSQPELGVTSLLIPDCASTVGLRLGRLTNPPGDPEVATPQTTL